MSANLFQKLKPKILRAIAIEIMRTLISSFEISIFIVIIF